MHPGVDFSQNYELSNYYYENCDNMYGYSSHEQVAPYTVYCCADSGNLLPFYNTSDCTPYYIVPLKVNEHDYTIHEDHGPNPGETPEDPYENGRKEQVEAKASSSRQANGENQGEIHPETKESTLTEKKSWSNYQLPENVAAASDHGEFDRRNGYRLLCPFCKSNGESMDMYQSHRLVSVKGTVACPILRNYVCPLCHATGDNAHTQKYCPSRSFEQQQDAKFRFPRLVRSSVGKYKLCRY